MSGGGSGAQSNGSAAAPPRCLDIFTVDSVAAGNNRRNFAASPTPHLGSLSHQRGSAGTARAYAPPSYFAATSNARKLSEGRGREGTATNGSTPKVSEKETILHGWEMRWRWNVDRVRSQEFSRSTIQIMMTKATSRITASEGTDKSCASEKRFSAQPSCSTHARTRAHCLNVDRHVLMTELN